MLDMDMRSRSGPRMSVAEQIIHGGDAEELHGGVEGVAELVQLGSPMRV